MARCKPKTIYICDKCKKTFTKEGWYEKHKEICVIIVKKRFAPRAGKAKKKIKIPKKQKVSREKKCDKCGKLNTKKHDLVCGKTTEERNVSNFKFMVDDWNDTDDTCENYSVTSSVKKPFKCKKCGYCWTVRIVDRFHCGCPRCSGRVVSERTSLANAEALKSEWNTEKNGDINAFSMYSSKKAWWTCPDKHEFYQRISDRTGHGSGCPYCAMSGGEQIIRHVLTKRGIKFEIQKTFEELNNGRLRYDFGIPLASGKWFLIEYDGKQHSKPIAVFGGEEMFKTMQKNDGLKNKYAEDSGHILKRIDAVTLATITKAANEAADLILNNSPKEPKRKSRKRRISEDEEVSVQK
jgi:hypothetical protein